ncbi:MAG: hypothetical protein HFF17_03845 [Oscillospiraceae bacterium]|nr:hypothetical protein [Oscillospiraceae bacterium]
MEQPVSLHAAQFLLACGLGAALGLFYDLLRALRRRRPRLTRGLDALYCAVLLPALLLFALYAGRGQFRLFFYPALALGAAGYFLTLSRGVLRSLDRFYRVIHGVFRALTAPARFFSKKTAILAKKIFSFAAKWVKMVVIRTRSAHMRRSDPGGDQHEVQKIIVVDQAGDPGSGGVRYRYPGLAAVADLDQARGNGGSGEEHRRRRAGKAAPGGRHRQHGHRRGR